MNRRQFLQRLMMTPAVLPALPGMLKVGEDEPVKVDPLVSGCPVVKDGVAHFTVYDNSGSYMICASGDYFSDGTIKFNKV